MSPDHKSNESPYSKRAALSRKPGDEEPEEDGKPTLGHVRQSTETRQQRMVAALHAMDDSNWMTVFRGIGADELALALVGVESELVERVTKAIPDQGAAAAFQQFLAKGNSHVSSSVVDDAQGKLLRLASL